MRRLQLTRLSTSRPDDQHAFPGDTCGDENCRDARGHRSLIGVYATKKKHGLVIRYLSCNECGWKPQQNKLVNVDPDHEQPDSPPE